MNLNATGNGGCHPGRILRSYWTRGDPCAALDRAKCWSLHSLKGWMRFAVSMRARKGALSLGLMPGVITFFMPSSVRVYDPDGSFRQTVVYDCPGSPPTTMPAPAPCAGARPRRRIAAKTVIIEKTLITTMRRGPATDGTRGWAGVMRRGKHEASAASPPSGGGCGPDRLCAHLFRIQISKY
ncbi:hypothetical protein T492DRAFT_971530 [Pavlovales sp. CCMP2436]|nr:hypothetical protein T492DRAFT_971530 [Pavlovales sp. CCMP2436]